MSRSRKPIAPSVMAAATPTVVEASSKPAMLSRLPDGAWLLKTTTCNKLGARSSGQIEYRIACNAERSELYLSISGNGGGGYFSKEWLPISRLAELLAQLQASGQPFATKQLKPAFVGRSVNNPPFLAAILRAEQLSAADPANPLLSRVGGDIEVWRKAVLKLKGEPWSEAALAAASDRDTLATQLESTVGQDAEPATELPAS